MGNRRPFLLIGLGATTAHALLAAVCAVAGSWLLVGFFAACALATAAVMALADRLTGGAPGDEDDDGGGGPRGPDPDDGGPPWWPEFEAAFRRHAAERPRDPRLPV